MGKHPTFPFRGRMSDVRGRALRRRQLSNAQLGLQLPPGTARPGHRGGLGWETRGPAVSLESGYVTAPEY